MHHAAKKRSAKLDTLCGDTTPAYSARPINAPTAGQPPSGNCSTDNVTPPLFRAFDPPIALKLRVSLKVASALAAYMLSDLFERASERQPSKSDCCRLDAVNIQSSLLILVEQLGTQASYSRRSLCVKSNAVDSAAVCARKWLHAFCVKLDCVLNA